ncbi:hypothetical protein [Arsukibacterium sp.]|uniref:hypothetical protein n=1 Tax=Arsukibacterium sp. TaxID=1977258 RepID=UPI002FD9ECC5
MSFGKAIIGGTMLGGAYQDAKDAKKIARAQSDASNKATEAQLTANRENIAFQKELFEQQRQDAAPWRDIGIQALGSLQRGMESGQFDPGQFNFNFEADPGYQFRLAEGQKAMDRSAAARGNLLSGGQAKALTQYNQGMASQEYGNAFNRAAQQYSMEAGRLNNQFNQFAGMAGVGQVANQQVQQAGSQMGQAVGQGTLNMGNALANNAYNQGNIQSQKIGAYGNIRNNLYTNVLTAAMGGM